MDIGILDMDTIDIPFIVSHVNDPDEDNEWDRIFSYDCPQSIIKTPLGNTVLLSIN